MEQYFKIRAYGFGELAQLYFPNITKSSASWQLTRWINDSLELKQNLERNGKKSRQRVLTPIQVKMIIDTFGEP